MEKMTIEIDFDLYKAIVANSHYFNEQPNDVLKRLIRLKNENSISALPENNQTQSAGLLVRGNVLKNGLNLQKRYKGKLYEAKVLNGYIEMAGNKYPSPSSAGIAITKSNVNGWRFWNYFDEKENKWKVLETLKSN
jgi:hypothetical protein